MDGWSSLFNSVIIIHAEVSIITAISVQVYTRQAKVINIDTLPLEENTTSRTRLTKHVKHISLELPNNLLCFVSP